MRGIPRKERLARPFAPQLMLAVIGQVGHPVWFMIIVLIGLMVFCTYLGIFRNQQVFRYREALRERVSRAAEQDIAAGDYTGWLKRYDALRSVSYHTMMLEFWRPLDSFYHDMSFADYKDYDEHATNKPK